MLKIDTKRATLTAAYPNILATRYASDEMVAIFDPVNRIRLERTFWISVLEAQQKLGVPVGDGVLDAYRAVIDDVDLESIAERDRMLKHDVKARLEEFNGLAGHQDIHKGLTSRDLTENVEQLQIKQGLELVEQRVLALLSALAESAATHSALTIVGRTHNVPAQPTTLGKRLAQIGEELLVAYRALRHLMADLPLRGIKGPVGTQQDQMDLLGTAEQVANLDRLVADSLGFEHISSVVGQVYPRSQDLAAVSQLVQLASAPANLALSVRLMAGHNLVTEGFVEGQVGSSAMPHKMNTRSCERVNGLFNILRGHLTMAAGLAGDQWNEGDVSCSVVRRVVIPDAFFAFDGLCETTFAVLRGFGPFPEVIEQEVREYLPFLATTKMLILAVKGGMGREDAHEVIKSHAVATALDMRAGKTDGSDLIRRLGADEAFPADSGELWSAIGDAGSLVGTADDQVRRFSTQVSELVAKRPESSYRGAEIL